MSVRPAGPRLVHRQLADLIRSQIEDGSLAAGALLPTEAALQREHGVGRDAVRKAMVLLRIADLIITIPGEGSRVRVATEPRPTVVRLGHGDVAMVRMPADRDRDSLGLPDGAPVVDVGRADGGHELFLASRVALVGTLDRNDCYQS